MAITATCMHCERTISPSLDQQYWFDTRGNYRCGEGSHIGHPHIPLGSTISGTDNMAKPPKLAFPSEQEERELHEQAAREINESIERQHRQRARWPDDLRKAMAELAKLFPTMRDVPGTDPWDVHQLMAWMNTGAPTTGSWHAAMFLLGVWNPHTKWNQEGVKMKKSATGKFDLFVAMHGWDQQHIDAAREWIANPFFP